MGPKNRCKELSVDIIINYVGILTSRSHVRLSTSAFVINIIESNSKTRGYSLHNHSSPFSGACAAFASKHPGLMAW